MENKGSFLARRKFLGWLSVLSVAATAGIPLFLRKNSPVKTKTIKMLTQDGKLVEVDESLIRRTGKKVTNTELRGWINKN